MNNIELIKPLLEFNSKDTFYFLQILQRKKEHPELSRNSNVIKNYYIDSVEYLDRKMDEIIKLCDFFNARAMLRLTPRSYKKTALDNLKQIAQCIQEDNYKAVSKSYSSSSGSTTEGTFKRWLIDIDTVLSHSETNYIINTINKVSPTNDNQKVLAIIPSKTGCHIITKPFDKITFERDFDFTFDIHKDNPSNLYIPESLIK